MSMALAYTDTARNNAMRTAKARYTSCPPALSCTDCPSKINMVVRQLTQYAGLCRLGTAWYRRCLLYTSPSPRD